jgi:hypothetical protein
MILSFFVHKHDFGLYLEKLSIIINFILLKRNMLELTS